MDGLHDFTIGGVVRQALRILSRHPAAYVVSALVLEALPNWGIPFLTMPYAQALQSSLSTGPGPHAIGFVWFFGLTALPTLVAYVGGLILAATMVHLAVSEFMGQPSRFVDGLRTGLVLLLPILVIKILAFLGIMLGNLLLVVPGIILTLMWLIVLPVYVAERPGIGAVFGRSRQLTAGFRWKIVGLLLLYGLVVAVAFSIVAGLGALLVSRGVPSGVVIGLGLLTAALTAVAGLLSSAGIAAIYIELRRAKEGTLPGDLVAAFE